MSLRRTPPTDGRKWYICGLLKFAGREILLADDFIEITESTAGRIWPAHARLLAPIEVRIDAGWGKVDAEPASATLQVSMQDEIRDVFLNGGFLALQGRCEVFLHVEGDDWDLREILLEGVVQVLSVGGNGDAFSIAVVQEDYAISVLVPDLTEVIDDDQGTIGIGNEVEDNVGRPYQIVFGRQTNANSRITLSEAVPYCQSTGSPITYRKVMIAGHPVGSVEVFIVDSDGNLEYLPVEVGNDVLGRPFSFVDIQSSTVLTLDEGTTYQTIWAGSGGSLNHEGGPVLTAGSLVDYLAKRTRNAIDYTLLSAGRPFLDSFTVVGVIEECTSVKDWLADTICAEIGCTMTPTPTGSFLWPWPSEAKIGSEVAHLFTEAGGVVRSSEIVVEDKDVINSFLVNYEIDATSGETKKSVSLGFLEAEFFSSECSASQSVYGIRSSTSESVLFAQQEDVLKSLYRKASIYALPRSRVSYILSEEYSWLRPRDTIRIEDPDINLDAYAVVDAISISETRFSVDLVILQRA